MNAGSVGWLDAGNARRCLALLADPSPAGRSCGWGVHPRHSRHGRSHRCGGSGPLRQGTHQPHPAARDRQGDQHSRPEGGPAGWGCVPGTGGRTRHAQSVTALCYRRIKAGFAPEYPGHRKSCGMAQPTFRVWRTPLPYASGRLVRPAVESRDCPGRNGNWRSRVVSTGASAKLLTVTRPADVQWAAYVTGGRHHPRQAISCWPERSPDAARGSSTVTVVPTPT